jgi:hypothetical protein
LVFELSIFNILVEARREIHRTLGPEEPGAGLRIVEWREGWP